MTGALAPLFAKVLEEHELGLQAEWWGFSERVEARRRFDAALSSIERHVQDMESAIEEWAFDQGYDSLSAERIAVDIRNRAAALPAREKEEE